MKGPLLEAYVSRAATVFNELKKPYAEALAALAPA